MILKCFLGKQRELPAACVFDELNCVTFLYFTFYALLIQSCKILALITRMAESRAHTFAKTQPVSLSSVKPNPIHNSIALDHFKF